MRFPLDEVGVLALLEILDPKVVRDLTNSPQSIIPLASNFLAIAPENTLEQDNEWGLFRQYKQIPVSSKSIPEFWYSIHNLKDGFDHSKFERLSQFMTNLTVLHPSLVCVERIFSPSKLHKDKVH
uniref:HAT C-terminal dimerisation domain-containing protein n=1 Tax=Octopus bimaculoides TaxID=37653 RepID=A0A0L8GVX5_OCTBM